MWIDNMPFVVSHGTVYIKAASILSTFEMLMNVVPMGFFDNDTLYVKLPDVIQYYGQLQDETGRKMYAALNQIKAKFEAGEARLFDEEGRQVDSDGNPIKEASK